MTATRRVRAITAVLATLTAAMLATTAGNDAHAATASAGAAAQTPAKTTLRLHITGCDRCSVQLQRAVTGHPVVWTSTKQSIGSDERAVFHLRTSRTKGLSFVLRAPWQGDTGAVPNIVTRYAGHAIDSYVHRTGARHARRAEGCWAGTNLDEVRLDFHVSRVSAKTVDGQATSVPLAYATHTMSSWKPMVKTFKGTIANQDAFYCTKPPTSKVTFTAAGCRGCDVQAMTGALRPENTWAAEPQKIKDGTVTFRVPRPLTRGLSMTVVAPWEGNTGYTTVVAFRYGGHAVGDPVSFADARSSKRGSPCWGGTHDTDLTIPLTVREVTVPGNFGPTDGTIAYADITQSWLKPMMTAGKGVLGSQEVIVCQR